MKKIINYLLTIIMLVSCFAFVTGCSNGVTNINYITNYQNVSRGVQAKDTDGSDLYIIKNRQANYKVVISQTADVVEQKAANWLVDYLYKSTKCKLTIIDDSKVSNADNGKYISIGETSLLDNSGITVNFATLGDDGYVFHLSNNTLYLCGANSVGTLYAVYDLLEQSIGYEAFAKDEIYYNKQTSVPMYIFNNNVTLPDFQYRAVTYGDIRDPEDGCIMKLVAYKSLYADDWPMGVHSIPLLVSESDHPEWFNNGQLCMTIEEARLEVVRKLKEYITNNPYSRYFMLGHGDTPFGCGCANCAEESSKNGGVGGLYVIWLNKIGEEIEQWMKNNDMQDRTVYILALAYQAYQKAPTITKENGEIAPVNENVVCRPNVGIYYAPIAACYAHSLDDPQCEVNVKGRFVENLKGWASVTNTLMIHTYCFEYYDALFPFNDYGGLTGNYKLFKDIGMYGVKDETLQINDTSPFSALKLYIRSKMLWNTDNDINVLMDKFFENYYKEAAPFMKQYLDEIRLQYARLGVELNSNGCYGFNKIGAYYMEAANWKMDLLKKYQKLIDNAYDAIDNAGYSEEEHEKMRLRIRIDELFITHYYVNDYSAYFSATEYQELKSAYDRDCALLGIYTFGG